MRTTQAGNTGHAGNTTNRTDGAGTGEAGQLQILILSMIIFGTIGICRRYISLPSDVLAFARGIMGGIFLLLVQRAKGLSFAWGQIRKMDFGLLVLTGALIGFNWILLFEAYNYTTVAVATLCYYMQPVIVILLSPLVLKERMRCRQIICAVISLGGMVLVSGVLGGASAGTSGVKGVVLGLGAAVLYASVVLLNKRIGGVPVYEKTIIQLLSAAIVLLPYMACTGTLHAYSLDTRGVVLLLTVGIVHTGIAYALYFGAIERLPARTCALLSYIDPVSAVLLSAIFLHEPMSGYGIVGTVLIIGAAIVSEL